MNYADIEKGIAALGDKAKNNALAVEDMDGGTFTISNGGVFGSLFGTPIINPPQSAILGMHGIFDRPVARNGQVKIFIYLLSLYLEIIRKGDYWKGKDCFNAFVHIPLYFCSSSGGHSSHDVRGSDLRSPAD